MVSAKRFMFFFYGERYYLLVLCFRFQTRKSSHSKIKENLLIIQIHAFRIKIPEGGSTDQYGLYRDVLLDRV